MRVLLLSLIFASIAHAGPVQRDIFVCGSTVPFPFFGEFAPALYGFSSTGLQDKLFRIRGYQGIEKNLSSLELPAAAAATDFESLLELKDVPLCIHGSLETANRHDGVRYYLAPTSYRFFTQDPDLLLPSQLLGDYQGIVNSDKSVNGYQHLPSNTATNLTLLSIEGKDRLLRFYSPNLPRLIKEILLPDCPTPLGRLLKDPSLLATLVKRLDKGTLTADTQFECTPDDPILIKFIFTHDHGKKSAHVKIQHPSQKTYARFTLFHK